MLDERFDRAHHPEQFSHESFDPELKTEGLTADERFDDGFDGEPSTRDFGELSRAAQAEGQLRAVEPLSRMPSPERVEGQEIEAGTLLILACAVGWSFARMWKPGMNDIPHSGCLPLEEYLLERSLPLEVDETFTVCGRPWLTLR